jgi:DNA-binding MarR family transcriptional regulator
MSSRDLDDAFKEISHTTRKLTHLGLTPIQTEVLKEIVDGNRTLSELTLAIYQSRYTDDKFQTYHSRIKRAVRSLERRGFVSKKRILGRDKPYGLTQHGIAKIASIAPGISDPAVFEVWDMVVFPVTFLLALAAWLTFEPAITNLFSLLLGISIVRAARLVRRVI